MEEVMMDVDGYDEQQIMPDALPFARRLVFFLTLFIVMLIGWIDDFGLFLFCGSYQLKQWTKQFVKIP
jgi:hypothetical protein